MNFAKSSVLNFEFDDDRSANAVQCLVSYFDYGSVYNGNPGQLVLVQLKVIYFQSKKKTSGVEPLKNFMGAKIL